MFVKTGYAPQPQEGSGPGGALQASDIINDSGVQGDSVKDALDELNTGPGGSVFQEELITLDASQVGNNAISLQSTPRQDLDISFKIAGSTVNLRDFHFFVTGSTLSWSGTILSGIVEEGDVVQIGYYI